jgi:AraC family transcriptional regulator
MSMSRVAAVTREKPPPMRLPSYGCGQLRMSSRGLGWQALNFERRESRRGFRELPYGSRSHLLFVGSTHGSVLREAEGVQVESELTPGCVMLVPARTPVRWSWSKPIGCSVLMLDPAVVEQVAREAFGLAPEVYQLALSERRSDTAIATVAGVLAREAMARNQGGALYAQSLATMLSVHLLRHYARGVEGAAPDSTALRSGGGTDALSPDAEPEGMNQPRAVMDAVHYIRQNYTRDVTLSDLGAAVHLSPFYLARLFKQTLGVTPHQYLIRVRVDSVRSMLSAGAGRRSLADIAGAAGFSDQSHLTRQFKRITGMTPSRFRG